MRFKTLASAAVIALSPLGAHAALTSPSPIQVVGPSFSDIELASFTLDEISNVTGAVGFSPYVLIPTGFQLALPPVHFNSVSVYRSTQNVATLALSSTNDFTFSNLTAGAYSLKASGLLTGTNFIAAQYTTAVVPEPEIFGMLLLGAGVVGTLARRRKNRTTSTQVA